MKKLNELIAVFDSEVSNELRDEVLQFAKTYAEVDEHTRYLGMDSILKRYQSEKVSPTTDPWETLSLLMSAVTGNRWATGKFAYYYHITRKLSRATTSEFAGKVWTMIRETPIAPAAMQNILEHALAMARVKGCSFEDAFELTIKRLHKVTVNGHPWHKYLWKPERWAALRKLDGIPMKAPAGQRKYKSARAETPVKTRRRPSVAEAKAAERLRAVFEEYLTIRLKSLPEETRGLETALAVGEFDRMLAFIRAATLTQITDEELKNRSRYTEACQELGLEAPKTGDPLALGVVKKAYRDLAKVTHPDRHPSADPTQRAQLQADFQRITEAHKFIAAYTERNAS